MTAAEVCARTSKSPEWCSFLFEIVRCEKPNVVFEMGTSVGISGSYLGAALKANGEGRLVTLEGRPDAAKEAARGFASLGLPVSIVVGDFERTFRQSLETSAPIDLMFIDGNHHEEPTVRYFTEALPFLSPGSLVVFDDIRWSPGMTRAWETVQGHDAVTGAIDLRAIGLVRVGRRTSSGA